MINFVHIYVFCRLTLGYYDASDLANVSQHTVHGRLNVVLQILCTWFRDGLTDLLALA